MKTQSILETAFCLIGFSALALTSSAQAQIVDPTSAYSIGSFNGGNYTGSNDSYGTYGSAVAGNTIDGSGLDGSTTANVYTDPAGSTPSANATNTGNFFPYNPLPTGTATSVAETTNHAAANGRPEAETFNWVATDTGNPATQDTGINIVFNLGSSSNNIAGFHYWNLNDTGYTQYGIASALVLVSNSSTFASFTSLGTVNLTQASGLDSYTGADASLSFSGYQYVMLDNITTFGYTAGTAQGIGGGLQAGLSEIRFDEAPAPAPEPSTYALMGLGALALLVISRRRRTA